MMPRPMVLVFLLLILIITSQFEWKQPLVSEAESSPNVTQEQQQISKREEAVKEKIILSQEKDIQRLNELVQNLRKQLVQCRCSNNTMDGTSNFPNANVIELGRKQILED